MSLPEAFLENIELGLRNVGIHNDERKSRNSKDYLPNGKGMYRDLKEEDVEEEEDDNDIEADILRQSGYATIKKPCHQPIPVKKKAVVEEGEEEEEDEDEDDIDADILRQSGYATVKKPCNQPMPVKKKAVVEEEEEEEEEEEDEDDIEADILRQSGYATVKKSCNQPMPVKLVKDDDDDDDEDEEDDDDDITGYMRKQSGYGNEEDGDEEEVEDDITTDILKQSGYGSMKKPLHLPTPKTAAPVKLVSALRGSREKEGIPTKNLSVTWSPEVYDPNPSAETFVRIKKPRLKTDSKKIQEFKKNGKPIGKDKGKASKGGRGGAGSSRDKKSKYSNNSRRSYGSFDNDD